MSINNVSTEFNLAVKEMNRAINKVLHIARFNSFTPNPVVEQYATTPAPTTEKDLSRFMRPTVKHQDEVKRTAVPHTESSIDEALKIISENDKKIRELDIEKQKNADKVNKAIIDSKDTMEFIQDDNTGEPNKKLIPYSESSIDEAYYFSEERELSEEEVQGIEISKAMDKIEEQKQFDKDKLEENKVPEFLKPKGFKTSNFDELVNVQKLKDEKITKREELKQNLINSINSFLAEHRCFSSSHFYQTIIADNKSTLFTDVNIHNADIHAKLDRLLVNRGYVKKMWSSPRLVSGIVWINSCNEASSYDDERLFETLVNSEPKGMYSNLLNHEIRTNKGYQPVNKNSFIK